MKIKQTKSISVNNPPDFCPSISIYRKYAVFAAIFPCHVFLLFLLFPFLSSFANSADVSANKSELFDVNYRALISQADLIYLSPVKNTMSGQPIGNGRMGTAVWTTDDGVHFQINRTDFFSVNSNHRGPATHVTNEVAARMGKSVPLVDYCGACAKIDIDLGDKTFRDGKYQQRLSLYDAESTVWGEQVRVRCFVSAKRDVMAIEIEDLRKSPQDIQIRLSTWRAPTAKVGDHVSSSKLRQEDHTVCIAHIVQERDYHCASAVAMTCVEKDVRIENTSQQAFAITVPATRSKENTTTTVFVSSAASFQPNAEVCEAAIDGLQDVSGKTYADLRVAHTDWWHDFWSSTGFVYINSDDAVAKFMEAMRTVHLYYAASSSRGSLPPKWNGSIFITNGDVRPWGSQVVVWTTETFYWPLLAADAVQLSNPFFDTYVRHIPAAKQAARQRWGVAGGAYYPEFYPFDGPVVLSEDVAEEFRAVCRRQRSNLELSEKALALCQYEAQLVTVACYKNALGHISHLVSSGSELALHAWWRYRHTGDEQWLRTHAYPLLRETVEFYRHFAKYGDDDHYHIHGTHVHEDFWLVDDGIMDLAAIRGTVPLALRAAEILGVDRKLQLSWQSFLDDLAPYPMGSDSRSQALQGAVLSDDAWSAGHRGKIDGQHNPEDVWLTPVFPFEDWTGETRDPLTDNIVNILIERAQGIPAIQSGTQYGTVLRTPMVWARAGRVPAMRDMLAAFYANYAALPNGQSPILGQTLEHTGLLTMTLQEMLLQSVSPRPGQAEIIRVFPSWPPTWDGSFRLLARGAFLVSSTRNQGQVEFIEVESRIGGICQVRNPWNAECSIEDSSGDEHKSSDDILRFITQAGSKYRIVPTEKPEVKPTQITPSISGRPYGYRHELPNGRTVGATLGRHSR